MRRDWGRRALRHSDPAILRAWPKLLGPERVKRAFAYSEFADEGAALAIGSDSPTAPHVPLSNLYVATTRKSAREPMTGDAPVNGNFRLELGQAVNAATSGAAYSFFAEERIGSLEVGKLADFCVVDTRWDGGLACSAGSRDVVWRAEGVWEWSLKARGEVTGGGDERR
jgi:predicted amidohydrolase YtcJ